MSKPEALQAPDDWRSNNVAEMAHAGDDHDSHRMVAGGLSSQRSLPAYRAREARKPAPGTVRTSLSAVSGTCRLPISCHGFGFVATAGPVWPRRRRERTILVLRSGLCSMSTGSNFDAGGSLDLRDGKMSLRPPEAESGHFPFGASVTSFPGKTLLLQCGVAG